jgi:NAD(P)-dependent dehydrogenase (short-subunit alcohol dehydrogenase family)
MAGELKGKVAAVTGAAAGIGLAGTEAMLAAGARVVLVDHDEAAVTALREKHGDAVIPLVIDLLNPQSCATLLPRVLEKAGRLDILHANAGIYLGGDLVDADTDAIDRMLNLNINAVMKNVRDVLPHMIERGSGAPSIATPSSFLLASDPDVRSVRVAREPPGAYAEGTTSSDSRLSARKSGRRGWPRSASRSRRQKFASSKKSKPTRHASGSKLTNRLVVYLPGTAPWFAGDDSITAASLLLP